MFTSLVRSQVNRPDFYAWLSVVLFVSARFQLDKTPGPVMLFKPWVSPLTGALAFCGD
jgi:hypothetical protein